MAGPFYFAWVASSETTFGPEHWREDEDVFSFEIEHAEGEAATLSVQIKNPLVGLLAPGRKTWLWFSWDDGEHVHALFFGRLISVPDDLFGEVVTLKFIAMPLDYIERKRSLAPALQVRPFWDPVFLDSARRLDPDALLEGYSALWHVDRIDHSVTISDIIAGEDGLADFEEEDAFYDSVKLHIDAPPLKSILVDASVSWEQQATGTLDLGHKWFRTYSGDGLVSGWPKPYSSLGAGWSVANSTIADIYDVANTQTVTFSGDWRNEATSHNFGDTMSLQTSRTQPIFKGPFWSALLTFSSKASHISTNPDQKDEPTASVQSTTVFVPEWLIAGSLVLRYEAKRARTENVRFTLGADVQPVFTDPGGTAADFAQDSELLQIEGTVGIEGPYGTSRGVWAAGTRYALYDYFQAPAPDGRAFSVLRDHVSLPAFNPDASAEQWVPGAYYAAGDTVFSGGAYYAVLVNHTSAASFSATAVSVNGAIIYEQRIDAAGGGRYYSEIAHLRGSWAPSTLYLSGDMFLAPDGYYYQVNIGHTSASTFDPYAADASGRLLHSLLLNPPPIGDISRADYFPTDRGLWSLEHLIARARAHLLLRARAVRLSFDCRFERAIGLSCRMNARLFDRRLPGASALGKVTAYKLTGDGDSGRLIGNVTIGCAVGQGNAIAGADGDPDYVSTGYVQRGYQVYSGQVDLIGGGDVGYTVPAVTSIDDGLRFPLDRGQVVISEAFQTGSTEQRLAIIQAYKGAQRDQQTEAYRAAGTPADLADRMAAATFDSAKAQTQAFVEALTSTPSWYELVLRPVQNGPFAAEYDITVTPLMIPKQIDLGS